MKEFNGFLDASFDAQAGYWDTEGPESPADLDQREAQCVSCGAKLEEWEEEDL